MKVQIIQTPHGEEMVILSRADFERLRAKAEDAADEARAEEMIGRMRDGAEETVPAEMVKRLLTDESPLKVWREHRGMTQQQLAAAAPMSRMYLSQVERGERQGSLKLMRRLAEILRVDRDDLSPTRAA